MHTAPAASARIRSNVSQCCFPVGAMGVWNRTKRFVRQTTAHGAFIQYACPHCTRTAHAPHANTLSVGALLVQSGSHATQQTDSYSEADTQSRASICLIRVSTDLRTSPFEGTRSSDEAMI